MSNDSSYERILAAMVDEIAQVGKLPWTTPWRPSLDWPVSVDKRPYTGGNRWYLGMVAKRVGEPPVYGTYKAHGRHGGQVRKGEKSYPAFFWSFIETTDEATGTVKTIPLLKVYAVFGHWQCEYENELPVVSERRIGKEGLPNQTEAQAELDGILAEYLLSNNIAVDWTHGSAAYSPTSDMIYMPPPAAFTYQDYMLATLTHEAAHSTGHESRLNRPSLMDPAANFGTEMYGREELVAELSTCFVLSETGVATTHTNRNNAIYLNNWLTALKADPRMLVWASSRAEKAANLLLGRVEVDATEADEQPAAQPTAP